MSICSSASAYDLGMADDANARITALEARLAELMDEVDRLRAGRSRSMRETYRCPCCGGTKILHFKNVKDIGQRGLYDLALQKRHSVWSGVKEVGGVLQAFACRNCRLVEWHAATLVDVTPDGHDIVELDGSEPPPPGTPYR
jgi:hypothetical protein